MKLNLIDVNKLLNPGYTDMFDDPIKLDVFTRQAIVSQPVIPAIPMGWISRYSCSDISNADYLAIIRMVNAWEEDNG